MKSNEESIPSNAPNRSPRIAPIPVTLESKSLACAYSVASSRKVSINSGSTGLPSGNKSVATLELNGRLANIAFPSCEGMAKICSPGFKYAEIGTSLVPMFFAPS
ncbi:unannotated protein [freshwater metagenome]|uniref:Unannotated protein n=1 Tax=freshwater metagenome TaxID=449393 RepID=A0A6J6IZH6_9ZZZZ